MRLKPIHVEHSMHPLDGEWVGFISVRLDEDTLQRIGKFQVKVEHWEDFQKRMEPVATFAWSFN